MKVGVFLLTLKCKKPLKIQAAFVRYVEGKRLENEFIQDSDFVCFTIRDLDKCRNIATQIKQSIQLDGGFGLAKHTPTKKRLNKDLWSSHPEHKQDCLSPPKSRYRAGKDDGLF